MPAVQPCASACKSLEGKPLGILEAGQIQPANEQGQRIVLAAGQGDDGIHGNLDGIHGNLWASPPV
jgi:hypothetical protein